MKRKHIVGALLGISVVITVILIVGSFVDYAQPGPSAAAMQKIYLARIIRFGCWIIGIQAMTALLVLTDNKPK
jgi:hypothetical protein